MMRRICPVLILVVGCAGERPEGVAPTARGGGPVVRWDLDAKPLPEVPLPNDVATRIDPTSPTGRRINVSVIAPTRLEADLRKKANRLDGFGTFMPITVSFDKPLDVADVRKRHHDDEDPSNDAVLLVNVDPKSPGYKEHVPLDLGGGAFPVVLEQPDNYFDNDPRRGSMNLLYETVQEDLDCDGELDLGEDTDFDGHLDAPNVHGLEWAEDQNCNGALDPGEDFDCDGRLDENPSIAGDLPEDANGNGVLDAGEDMDCDGVLDTAPGAPAVPVTELRRAREDRALADHLLTFYELESNTLIARPIRPLREHTTYAVVLTKRLVGLDGKPVESPFPYVSHAGQSALLAGLPGAAAHNGLAMSDVAFTWAFTTGSTTFEMTQLRRGLYGHGPFAWLADAFPVDTLELERVRDDDDDQPFIVRVDDIKPVLPAIALALGVDGEAMPHVDALSHVVLGSFETPYFLVDRDGIGSAAYPADDDESFEIDPLTGDGVVGTGRVTFWCAVPKTIPGRFEPPFPVQVFGHGYGSSKFELMPQVGHFARFGIASCGLDAVGHGTGPAATGTVDIGGGEKPLRELAYDLLHTYNLGNFVYAVLKGRDRDLDNDGIGDSGGDFWTADLFHTRDVVRQSVIDHMQLIRIFRSFDGHRVGPLDTGGDGKPDLAGDFDGDGRVDLGGPDARYSVWGSSLGGILSAILAGVEPAFDAAAPHAGGAGLNDIGIRSIQGGVPEAVFMPLMGPMVAFDPVAGSTETELRFLVNDVNHRGSYPFHRTGAIRPGRLVVLKNLRNGEEARAIVPPSGRFRLAVAADALTATEKRPVLGYPDTLPPGPGTVTGGIAADVAPEVTDPTSLGDPLVIEVLDPETKVVEATIDTFNVEVVFQGARYPVGATLAAIAKGFGFSRNSPDFRRMLGLSSMILQGADPMSYAPHYYEAPLPSEDYDPTARPGTNVMVIPMVGDMNVPVNTAIQIAVASGTVGVETPDPRYGMSPHRFLVKSHAIEAVDRLWRYDFDVERKLSGCAFDGTTDRVMGLFDVDDLDHGLSEFRAPNHAEPLRATVRSSDGKRPDPVEHCNPGAALCGTVFEEPDGINAMRMPYTLHTGEHDLPGGCRKFDITRYMHNAIGVYFQSGGTRLVDDVCLATDDCDFFPWVE